MTDFTHLRVEVGEGLTYYIDPSEKERLVKDVAQEKDAFSGYEDAWSDETVWFRPCDVVGIATWESEGYRRYKEYHAHADKIDREVKPREDWR